jgi:hypothetical protein
VHHDGQIWSQALWDIRGTIIVQGSFDFPGTTMPDLARRTVTAEQLLYSTAVRIWQCGLMDQIRAVQGAVRLTGLLMSLLGAGKRA